ncbi:MAG: hypothetical protein ABIS35_00110 [Terracoccus sp.]
MALRTPRPTRRRALAATLALACLGAAACTAQVPDPTALSQAASATDGGGVRPDRPSGGATPVDPAPAAPGSAQPVRPTSTDLRPDPGMTAIQDAVRCTTRRPLGVARGAVPLAEVFPGSTTPALAAPDEVLPGPDAADPRRCPGELPPEPLCDEAVPWSGLDYDAFLTASGARRAVSGYLLTAPPQAGNEAPPESSPGTRVVTYQLLDLVAGDPGGVVVHLERALRACADARPSTVTGADALIGTTRSDHGAGSSQVVLLRRGTHVVWAQLDGSGWEKGQREHALRVLVARLL